MKKVYLTLAFFLIGFILTAQKLPFQGYLEESGVPVNGTRSFNFELTDYGWSETLDSVTISNGIYNVVLGEITLLPDSIFININETPLSITVDGTIIGTVTLYKPLINGQSLLKNEESLSVKGPNGKIKADLNYFPTNNSGSLVINGANDSTKVILGTSAGGYEGGLFLYDSLRNSHVALRGLNTGGSLLLAKREAGALRSAIFGRTLGNRSNLQMYATNTTLDGASLMIENYTTANQIAGGPVMTGNYLRSGTDWKDNEGRILAAIGNTRDESGTDPAGSSGYLSLWGTNSFNAELTGKRWENNDFPTFQLFGNSDDGAGWWMRNFAVEVFEAPLGYDYTNMSLFNTDVGGISYENVFITSSLYAEKGGGVELRDSIGNTTITLQGNSGIGNFNNAAIGAQTNGIIHLYGEDNTAIDNLRLQLEVRPDGFGSSHAFIEMKDDSVNTTITLNGSTGVINAVTVNQTSDKRYKKGITTLDNSLANTLKLRGVSYYWKDQNKSQKRQIGVIAQEVEEVYPEFVHTNQEGYKSVNYAQMTAVLIEAIKELNAKVENLEKENAVLTTALNETKVLSEKINKLEKLLLENQKVVSN